MKSADPADLRKELTKKTNIVDASKIELKE